MNGRLVSAVVPTYNRAEMVGGAIESVLDQTYENVEVVVVNDGSTDDTPAVLADYAEDDRVRVLHNERNRGIPYTMNRGVEAARGEFVGVFGDDDRWYPEKVETQLAAFDAVGDDYCCVFTAGVITDGERVVERVNTGAAGELYPDVLLRMTVLPHSSQLVRTECIRAVGGFDTDFDIACDWDLTVRLARRWKFAYVPEVLVERTHHGGNVTADPEYNVQARDQIATKCREDIAAAGVADAFAAAVARERGLLALDREDRAGALRQFLTASVRQPTLEHAALALVSPFGSRGLGAARRIGAAVGR